jgi:ribosomal protein L16/L10AE
MRLVVVCCVEARMFHKSEEEEKVRVERGKGRVEYALAKVYAFYICRSIDAVK